MSTYKGLIRFINETEELALVEETPLVQNVAITSTGLTSTGSGTWEATLQAIVNEGSIVITIDGVTQTSVEHPLTTSTGRKIFTSTGAGYISADGLLYTTSGSWDMDICAAIFGTPYDSAKENIIDRVAGTIIINFVSAPTAGQDVRVSYTRDYFNETIGYTRTRMLRGDFSSLSVNDIIYYDYSGGAAEQEFEIDVERPGQS